MTEDEKKAAVRVMIDAEFARENELTCSDWPSLPFDQLETDMQHHIMECRLAALDALIALGWGPIAEAEDAYKIGHAQGFSGAYEAGERDGAGAMREAAAKACDAASRAHWRAWNKRNREDGGIASSDGVSLDEYKRAIRALPLPAPGSGESEGGKHAK